MAVTACPRSRPPLTAPIAALQRWLSAGLLNIAETLASIRRIPNSENRLRRTSPDRRPRAKRDDAAFKNSAPDRANRRNAVDDLWLHAARKLRDRNLFPSREQGLPASFHRIAQELHSPGRWR